MRAAAEELSHERYAHDRAVIALGDELRLRYESLASTAQQIREQQREDREIADRRHAQITGTLATITDRLAAHDQEHAAERRHRTQLDSVHEERDAELAGAVSEQRRRVDELWARVGKTGTGVLGSVGTAEILARVLTDQSALELVLSAVRWLGGW